MSADMKKRIEDIVSGTTEYPVKSKSFWLPNLDQIASYVEFELKKNYSKVSVCSYIKYLNQLEIFSRCEIFSCCEIFSSCDIFSPG